MQIRHPEETCYQLVRYRRRYAEHVDLDEMARLAGTAVETLHRMIEFDIVVPIVSRDNMYVSVACLPTIRRALRLHDELDVSWESMSLVLDLLDRVERLEAQLQSMQRPVRRARHRRRVIEIQRPFG